MADSISVDVSDIIGLAASFESSNGRIGGGVAAAVRETAKAVEATMRDSAPVGPTGDLKRSISTTFEGDGRGGLMSVTIGPTVDYARFVENGTAFMAPEPFVGPAGDAHRAEFEKRIDSAVEKSI